MRLSLAGKDRKRPFSGLCGHAPHRLQRIFLCVVDSVLERVGKSVERADNSFSGGRKAVPARGVDGLLDLLESIKIHGNRNSDPGHQQALKRPAERARGCFGVSFSHAMSPYSLWSRIALNSSLPPLQNPKSLACIAAGAVQPLQVLRARKAFRRSS